MFFTSGQLDPLSYVNLGLNPCSKSACVWPCGSLGFPGFLDRSKSKGIPLFQQYTNDEIQVLDLIREHLLRDTLPMEQPGRLIQDLNHTCVDGQLDHVNSGSLSVGQFENSIPFQAPQPFNVVECQRIANDSSFPTENPREADPKHLMQLLPESSDQNEKSSDPTLSIEPTQVFKTEDLDGISIRSNFLRKLQTDLKRKMPLLQE
ncbi:hypothetical protein TIFTF001_038818 [Ficus carica]|uniref:Uncharacterized protein n=1 Tax=Ficus carica TaxID=3494 RepID=A0AA88E7Y6_FICCA|nr:hypothetical protein TIFTF001_038818 [Ficus carica]